MVKINATLGMVSSGDFGQKPEAKVETGRELIGMGGLQHRFAFSVP